MSEALLKLEGVHTHIGAYHILHGVDFDVPAGKYSRVGDEEGQGQLIKPIGLDVDSAGNLYVADIGAKAVMVYGPDRRFLRRRSARGACAGPCRGAGAPRPRPRPGRSAESTAR